MPDSDSRAGGPLPREPVWPEGARSAAFFSFDVDGEAWLLGADERNARLPVTLSQAAYGPKVGVFQILKLLSRYEVTTTFFVPSWVAQNHPATVGAIVEAGHEVGLHGHLHERPDLLSREEELEIVGRSIGILESMTGTRPVGYRAPGAEVSQATVGILAEHGVRYSSQFMDDVFPYFHPGSSEVLELPIHWVCDDWGYSMVSPYAFPAPQVNPYVTNQHVIEAWSAEFDGIAEMGGLFVLVNHPQVTGRPARLQTLEELLAKARNSAGVWIANGRQIDSMWRERRPSVPSGRERAGLP